MSGTVRISSVNIGRAETLSYRLRSRVTGILKRPVDHPVMITEDGLAGDEILNQKHHGGKDQAVYAYSADDYAWWAAQTGRSFEPGLFGENLTVERLPSDLCVGDRLIINDVVLEATAARIPCATLAARLRDSGFGMTFRKAERPGIYFRVLDSGTVRAGDEGTLLDSGAGNVTVRELFRFSYEKRHDAAQLRRMLEAPLAERVRIKVEAALAAM